MVYGARVIADDTFHGLMFVAFLVFFAAFAIGCAQRAWATVLLCAGLACMAAAYVVVS